MYKIEFETADAEYEYEIDAKSGAILDYESEGKKTSSSKNKDGSKSTSSINKDGSKSTTTSEYIGKAKARDIALQDAGIDAGKVRELDIELDDDDGRVIYEIEFELGSTEYEYEVDAITGKILKSEVETDD